MSPINNGFYQFANHSRPYTLLISRNRDDWPRFELKSQAEQFVGSYTRFAVRWLSAHGYNPVTVRVIDGYSIPGAFDWSPNEARQLRDKILADYLDPSNTGKPMKNWRGLGHEIETKSLLYLSGCDSPKG